MGDLSATVSGAATEVIWLKTRVETLEKVAEQSRLEAGAAKGAVRKVAAMMEEMEKRRAKEVAMEIERRNEIE